MAQIAQISQFKKVFKVEYRVLPNDVLSYKFVFLGGGSSVRMGVDVDRVETLIAQIDAALTNGSEIFTALDGRRFEINEKLLRSIRDQFKKFVVSRGGSGAQVVEGGVSTSVKGATPVVNDGKKDSEAPASKASASATRQFPRSMDGGVVNRRKLSGVASLASESVNFNKPETPRSPRATEDEVSALAGETVKIFADELRAVLSPFVADLATLFDVLKKENAELKQILKTQKSDMSNGRNTPSTSRRRGRRDADSPLVGRGNTKGNSLPKGWRKCSVENPQYARVQTNRGRTSVIVARRKVS